MDRTEQDDGFCHLYAYKHHSDVHGDPCDAPLVPTVDDDGDGVLHCQTCGTSVLVYGFDYSITLHIEG